MNINFSNTVIQSGDSLTDLVKMSISGYLDTGALVADKVSDQFGNVESSRQLDDQAFVGQIKCHEDSIRRLPHLE